MDKPDDEKSIYLANLKQSLTLLKPDDEKSIYVANSTQSLTPLKPDDEKSIYVANSTQQSTPSTLSLNLLKKINFNIEKKVHVPLTITKSVGNIHPYTNVYLDITLYKDCYKLFEYYQNFENNFKSEIDTTYIIDLKDLINYLVFYFYEAVSYDNNIDELYISFSGSSISKTVTLLDENKLRCMFESCIPLIGKIFRKL